LNKWIHVFFFLKRFSGKKKKDGLVDLKYPIFLIKKKIFEFFSERMLVE